MPAEEKVPKKLLERLEELFKATDYVETAFFTQVYYPSKGEPPHGFIALKLRKQFDNELNVAIGKIVKGTIGSNQFVEIGPMTDFTSEWMTTPNVRVFYRKATSPYV